MLLKLNVMRIRSSVSKINDDNQVEFAIYPKGFGAVALNADCRMVNDDLDYATLVKGQPFDALVARYAEYDGRIDDKGKLIYKKDDNGHVIYKYEAIGIEKPAIHPFDIPKLYPSKSDEYPHALKCLTAVVNQAAEGENGAVLARSTVDGQEEYFRITSLTKMFQAQADDQHRERIYRALKSGDCVNIWVDRNGLTTQTGETNVINVTDVLYLSVNYR